MMQGGPLRRPPSRSEERIDEDDAAPLLGLLLLFPFNVIAYVDWVNMSVAGKPIAQEFGLSPVALGYLFSSFLWAYVLMMLPGGGLIDRWGAHVIASVATAVWSAAQMATGNFNSAFILAGALALIGAVVTLTLARTPIGEVRAPAAAQPRLAD